MPMSPYVKSLRAMIGNTLIEVPTVAVFAFDDARRVLLVRDAQSGLWTSPGGMVEPNETPADAAVREVWEEAGVYVELTHIVGVYGGPGFDVTYDNGDRLAWISTVFGARLLGGSARPDGVETIEARWFTEAEFANLDDCRRHVRTTLAAAFAWNGRASFEAATWRPPGF
jgi:ADP-ribose pyrophosphatase YjhB (NUDIX family)